MASFGGMSVVKDKSFPVLIEYVPMSHNSDALVEFSTITCNSRLEPGTLQSTRWVKPAQRRATGQWVVHLIARFTSVSVAN